MKLKYQRNNLTARVLCYRVQDPPIYLADLEIHYSNRNKNFLYLTPAILDWFLDLEIKIKEEMISIHPDLLWVSPLSIAGIRLVLHVVLLNSLNLDHSINLVPLFVAYNQLTKEARLKILALPDRSMERLSEDLSDLQV